MNAGTISTNAALVEALARLDPPTRLFGGIAEDALLTETLSRPHADVDVFVLRPELTRYLELFAGWGFDDFETRFEVRPNHPLALGCPRGEADLELGLFDQDTSGIYFEVIDSQGAPTKIYLPDDALSYPPTRIGSNEIRVLSPRALVDIRRGLELLSTFGPLREKDIRVQQRLLDAFFDGAPPDDPRIERS